MKEMLKLQLTILGNGPACPNSGGASSGYLVKGEDTSVVLDIGPGVVATPEFRKSLPKLSGIVISHLHIDHWLDLVPLSYLLKLSPVTQANTPFKVWTPPDTRNQLLKLIDELSMGYPLDAFDVEEYTAGTVLSLPGLQIEFQQVQHYIPTFAMRIENDAGSLCYSADSSLCKPLVSIANNSNLFICEAADGITSPKNSVQRGHMTGREAGAVAANANVGSLLLTHIWESHDPDQILKEVAKEFSGEFELARPGKTYQIYGERVRALPHDANNI